MKKILWLVVAILAIAGIYLLIFKPDWLVAGMPSHNQQLNVSSDKSDGPCTGHETAGRCADKCPAESDILQGFDPQTGAAICKTAPSPLPAISSQEFQGK